MGACHFVEYGYGPDAVSVFNTLHAAAEAEYGYDPYNGTISTCELGRCMATFPATKKGEKDTEKFLNENSGEKWVAHYIDMGVVEYRVRTVKKNVEKYNAVYRQKYAVCNFDGKILRPESKHLFDAKTPADEKALAYAKNGEAVCVRKMMVRLSGEDTVTTFSVEEKTVKKPTQAQLRNATVIPIHKYIFFGWAAC